MRNLEPAEVAKVARLWQWCEGQQACGRIDAFGGPIDGDWRVSAVHDNRPSTRFRGRMLGASIDTFLSVEGAVPDLRDPVTRDGLLRTARAAWGDDTLCAANDRHSWNIRYLAKTHPYAPVYIARAETETEAWIAAILAAPEPA